MIKLDSIKLRIPIETGALLSLNRSHSEVRVTRDEKAGLITCTIPANTKYGIGQIKETADSLILGFSAKVLQDNYLQAVSINTIEQALTTVNKHSPIMLDIARAIENATVLKCDSTQMVYPNYDVRRCTSSMMMLRVGHKYNVTNYDKKNNVGVEINRSIKTQKRRMIMYDKYLELTSGNKSHREFLKGCTNPLKIINDSKGALRVEQDHSSFKSMKERFQITQNLLLDILTSESNPNYDFLYKAMNDVSQLDLFLDSMKDMPLYRIEKIEGRKSIIEHFGRDIQLIKVWLKNKMKGRNAHYKYVKQYQQLIHQMDIEDYNNAAPNKYTSGIINEHILNLVKLAS